MTYPILTKWLEQVFSFAIKGLTLSSMRKPKGQQFLNITLCHFIISHFPNCQNGFVIHLDFGAIRKFSLN